MGVNSHTHHFGNIRSPVLFGSFRWAQAMLE